MCTYSRVDWPTIASNSKPPPPRCYNTTEVVDEIPFRIRFPISLNNHRILDRFKVSVPSGQTSRPMRALLVLVALAAPVRGIITFPTTPVRTTRMATVAATKLGHGYSQLCRDHFLPMAAVQSGLLRGGADAVSQSVQHSAGGEHILVMVMLGALVSGAGNAQWLRVLEGWYGSEASRGTVLRKTCTDYLCWAPIANSAYLFFLPLLTGKGMEAAFASVEGGFLSVMLMEMAIFMPYNLVAFEHIPVAVRPLTSAALAAVFTIGLTLLA